MTDLEKILIQNVCEIHDISMSDLLSKSRTNKCSSARFMVSSILRSANYNDSRIAELLCRARSSINHHSIKHAIYMATDKDYACKYNKIAFDSFSGLF